MPFTKHRVSSHCGCNVMVHSGPEAQWRPGEVGQSQKKNERSSQHKETRGNGRVLGPHHILSRCLVYEQKKKKRFCKLRWLRTFKNNIKVPLRSSEPKLVNHTPSPILSHLPPPQYCPIRPLPQGLVRETPWCSQTCQGKKYFGVFVTVTSLKLQSALNSLVSCAEFMSCFPWKF